ncbi:MAG TPA: carboxypeptidase-like regulatory domain-containing protein [Blastocatellia bacterium]|nr:carboxypeptidase-like regulatory domain-containing protein [Blastocatellia bacterium]
MKRVLFALTISLCLSTSLQAQSTNAALTGTVTDATQAVVPGATVTLQNVLTGVILTATTNEAGVYNFPSVQPGKFRVSAERDGFKKYVYTDVTLELSDRVVLNFALEVGTLSAGVVEVNASVDTRLALGNNSVGGVISGQKVQELPLPNRDALGLVLTQSGIIGDNFSGARIGTLNISRDGVNVQDQRINVGLASTIFTSVDLVQEVRVVTSPADAEFGRGSGQVQMITRSGTNEFHGSVFEAHRNTALNANTWFNNQRGVDPRTGEEISPRNFLIRNQFGGRLGGPIWKNRTFFHALYEGQRIAQRAAITSTVFTETARRGLFRFFPGVQNGNANAATPTVTFTGAPLKPSTATGDLQTVDLFTLNNGPRDPNRRGISSLMQQYLSLMPLPNNFQAGDGLNTAGHTWQRKSSSDFNHFSIKIDHSISSKHQLAYSFSRETGASLNGFVPQNLPTTLGGNSEQNDSFHSLQLISTLSPSLVNEARVGVLRPRLRFNAPWEVHGLDKFPKAGNTNYVVDFVSITDVFNIENDPQGRISPSYQFFDSLTWQRGRHAFKVGAEMRFVSTNGFNSFDVMPRAVIGSGGAAVQNVTNIAGIGQNATPAVNILNDLSGSLASLRQAFNSPGGNAPFLAGEGKQRTWQQREFSWFFKDDFKLRPNLTLNLGVRYEFYGVPYEANGKTMGIINGSGSIFGLSGRSLSDLFKPGVLNGALANTEQVGKNSPNADRLLYNNDYNNFAPAVGFSWSPKFLGENKTVIRAGYGIGYERNSLRLLDVLAGDQPGLRTVTTFTQTAYMSLANAPFPLSPQGRLFELVPLTDRTQTLRAYDTNLRTPYVQNWNVSVSRSLTKDMVLEARYVGNKGTRLIRGYDVNEANIFENGILEAFNAVVAGGTHPLMDRIFNGLNLGLGQIGTTPPGGSLITAGASLRTNANTRDFFAFNNPGGFANYLNSTNNFVTNRGDLLRRAGLPENFIVANPQFASARLTTNSASSSYHSFQLDFTKRFSSGWTLQSNYTFAKALGEEEGAGQEIIDSYRTLRNIRLDKRRMSFDIRHTFRNSGTYMLPIGPGGKFLTSGNGFLSRLLGQWQVGFIYNHFSGDPLTITAARSSFNQFADGTPILVGNFPKSAGSVVVDGTGVRYFANYTQIADPSIAKITTSQGLQARSTMRAIADANGNPLLVNPTPGLLGTMGPAYIEGPSTFRLDMNVLKRVKIKENVNFQFTANFIDALNTPQWGNPNTDINSVNFGRITGATGNRIIVLEGRINF